MPVSPRGRPGGETIVRLQVNSHSLSSCCVGDHLTLKFSTSVLCCFSRVCCNTRFHFKNSLHFFYFILFVKRRCKEWILIVSTLYFCLKNSEGLSGPKFLSLSFVSRVDTELGKRLYYLVSRGRRSERWGAGLFFEYYNVS